MQEKESQQSKDIYFSWKEKQQQKSIED